jgi:hypothetical protein
VKWAFLVMLMVSASALNVTYDGEVLAGPGETVVDVYLLPVNESGNIFMTCASDLEVSCSTYVTLETGSETSVPIKVFAERGSHRVNFSIGGDGFSFTVRSTNQTRVFLNMLEDYNDTFKVLEAKHGSHRLLELGESLVREGVARYGEGDYAAVEGICDNLRALQDDYYDQLNVPVEEAGPAELNLSYVTAGALAVVLGALYYRSRRKPKREPRTGELRELLKKEGIGGEPDG